MRALDLPYEAFVALNGHENCGVCGRSPKEDRRHDRDHDHLSGKPRGLLCPVCNGFLTKNVGRSSMPLTPEYLRAAADYLERASVHHATVLKL